VRESFFKLLSHLLVGFRMPGARHQFAPPMAMQQPIDGTVIDGMPDTLFKRAPDLPYRRDLPALGLCEKRG